MFQVDNDEVAAGRASSEPLTMFVKNLSFSTDEAGLRRCFEKAGLRVRSVSIPRKKAPGASEAALSMGFGFVECSDVDLVEKALKVGFFVLRPARSCRHPLRANRGSREVG